MRIRLLVGIALAASLAWAGSAREELVALRARLAASRDLGRASGWAAELKFAAAHKADPDLAAEVVYDVALSQRERDRSVVTQTLEGLLEAYPKAQPWAALATYELARSYGDRSSSAQPKAIGLYEKFLKFDGADPVRRADALLSLAKLYQGAAKHEEAIASFRAFLAQFPDHAEQCAGALAAVGTSLVELKRPKEAVDVYAKLCSDYPWELEGRRTLLLAVAQAFRTGEDAEGGIAAYEKLLQDLPPADARRAQAYMGLAMLYLQQKDNEKGIATYRRMAADKPLGASYRASAYRQLFDLYRRGNDHAGIIRLAYELIAAQPSAAQQSGNLLGEVVDSLIAEGRVEEAMGMAKANWRLTCLGAAAAGSGGGHWTASQDAVFTVVRALKAREGGLRSGNRFIAFVEYGAEGPDGTPGTADDVQDPTAGYRLPSDPERDRIFAAAAQRFIVDPLELGYLYLCWDKPDEALRAFRRYYLEASDPTRLQRAASLLAQALRALGRSEAEVDAFFDFQNYGPNGKDGKPKTADDLKDPILAAPKKNAK